MRLEILCHGTDYESNEEVVITDYCEFDECCCDDLFIRSVGGVLFKIGNVVEFASRMITNQIIHFDYSRDCSISVSVVKDDKTVWGLDLDLDLDYMRMDYILCADFGALGYKHEDMFKPDKEIFQVQIAKAIEEEISTDYQ